MLRISDQEAIRNPVHYLYTVANNLVKEHAVLDRRQASGIDIDEAPAHERLETLPAFGGDLDARQRDRKSTRLNSSHSQISYAVFCLKKKHTRAAINRSICLAKSFPGPHCW